MKGTVSEFLGDSVEPSAAKCRCVLSFFYLIHVPCGLPGMVATLTQHWVVLQADLTTL